MEAAVRIGLDIAKSVFQVHGVSASGEVVVRQRLRRSNVLQFFAKLPPCLVGLEACGAAHYWGRELRKFGHNVRLMPPGYVKAYLKGQKNDAADAEAICEAVSRPTMRFVGIKSPEQQSVMALHRVRLTLTRQRTQLSNSIRGHMAEYGLVAAVGRNGLAGLIAIVKDGDDERIPPCAQLPGNAGHAVGDAQRADIESDRRLGRRALDEIGRRLMEIQVSVRVLASAMIAAVPDPSSLSRGGIWRPGSVSCRSKLQRGKDRLGGITKQGIAILRQLLVIGALAGRSLCRASWNQATMAAAPAGSRKTRVAAVALANKTARMIWALMTSGERYREPLPAAA